MSLDEILPNPSRLLWALLAEEGITFTERERETYALGKLAVLLELETHVRIIEAVRGATMNDETRYTVSSALRAIQSSLQTSPESNVDRVIEWYDELLRRADASVVVDPDEPPASSSADPRSTDSPSRYTDEPDLEDTLSRLEEDDLLP